MSRSTTPVQRPSTPSPEEIAAEVQARVLAEERAMILAQDRASFLRKCQRFSIARKEYHDIFNTAIRLLEADPRFVSALAVPAFKAKRDELFAKFDLAIAAYKKSSTDTNPLGSNEKFDEVNGWIEKFKSWRYLPPAKLMGVVIASHAEQCNLHGFCSAHQNARMQSIHRDRDTAELSGISIVSSRR